MHRLSKLGYEALGSTEQRNRMHSLNHTEKELYNVGNVYFK